MSHRYESGASRRSRPGVARWWLPLLLGFALLSCLPPPASTGEDRDTVSRLLEKMASASQSLNYTGSFTFVTGDKSWTMRVAHSFDKQGEREVLETVAGELRKLYRDDHGYVAVVPDREWLVAGKAAGERSAAGVLKRQFDTSSEFYDYYLDGSEEIAGYACQVISIVPRDSHRFGYRLCLEAESGLLLKSQVVDKAGQPKEQLVFNRLEFPEQSPRIDFDESEYGWIEKPASEGKVRSEPNSLDLLPRWQLGWVPPGFKVVEDRTRAIAGSTEAVRHVVLDDGIATVSVFIKPLRGGEQYQASRDSAGALNTLMGVKQGFVVAVMGEVPETTIEAIFAGLKPRL